MRVGNPADERQQHADGVLGGGDHVAVRGVADEDASPRAGLDVDVVDADPGAPDDAEPRGVIQELGGDRGPGAGDQSVVVPDARVQRLARGLGELVDLDASFAQIREPLRGDRVDDQHAHTAQPSTEYPPSTGIAVPVTKSDAALARKTATPAMSSIVPQRPAGVRRSTLSWSSGT